jgi:hypothetical protein
MFCEPVPVQVSTEPARESIYRTTHPSHPEVDVMGETIEFRIVRIQKPEEVNVILGQSHFI